MSGSSSKDKIEQTASSSSSNPIPTVPGEEDLEMRYLKQELRGYASQGSWDRAKSILDCHPDLVRIPLTYDEGTILHVAVFRDYTNFVRQFVNYKHVTKEDLEIRDINGNTAFCAAAARGNTALLKIMYEKNEKLLRIHGQLRLLPVNLAITYGKEEALKYLSTRDLLDKMAFDDIRQFFFTAVSFKFYGVALELVNIYKKSLALARDEERKTALHIMALESCEDNNAKEIVGKLWRMGGQILEYKKRMELITTPSVLLFDAIKLGNLSFIKAVYDIKPKIWELKDSTTRQTMLHTAVLFQQHEILNFLLGLSSTIANKEAVDKNGNNALHYAAHQTNEEPTSLRPDLQIKREEKRFKEMEEKLGSELSTMRNKDGKTPSDMFHVHHRKISDEVKDTAKTVANSGMVVAALIVAVVFAAALTTPGDKSSAWFVVFIMTNAAALFTSALSIVAFWSIFISSTFKENHEFVTSLYPSLIIGKRLLFISLITMIMAFAAASFLIFGDKYKWAAYVVASFGLLTIFFILHQLSLFRRLLEIFSSSNIKLCLTSIKGMFCFPQE